MPTLAWSVSCACSAHWRGSSHILFQLLAASNGAIDYSNGLDAVGISWTTGSSWAQEIVRLRSSNIALGSSAKQDAAKELIAFLGALECELTQRVCFRSAEPWLRAG
ncbi:hypothetical protein EAH_00045080 [Eimeria acervulina]|uniref:Uncharacterized protein n=1 Tax=Eimeria acervulina TaxID=5801 RepID=U6GZA0_EIMAC|nr:hypothetical protein EAH_00045080 [Eimeria acervulina]CDI83864.1 hypothetical protein EAH_00045080 [Eimeria acervulina]